MPWFCVLCLLGRGSGQRATGKVTEQSSRIEPASTGDMKDSPSWRLICWQSFIIPSLKYTGFHGANVLRDEGLVFVEKCVLQCQKPALHFSKAYTVFTKKAYSGTTLQAFVFH